MKNPFSEVERLKRKARGEYLAYHRSLDHLDCGKTLGEMVSRQALQLKLKFNNTMDKLAKLDPNTPKTRL